jgi:hypothetical protein
MHVCAAFLHKKGHVQSIAMLIVIIAILITVIVITSCVKDHVQLSAFQFCMCRAVLL